MLFEIFDDGKFLGFEDAPHEEAAIVVFANKRYPRADPFKTLAEVRQDQGFPHREATAVAAYATMPPAEAATEVELSEYSKVFELLALADEAAATAARLRDAATRTSGLEREANTKQAAEAEAEVSHLEAALRGEELPEAHDAAELTPLKRASIIKRLGRRYTALASALDRPEEWAKACRVPNKRGWYYLERIEAECRARYGTAEQVPAADLSAAGQLRSIGR